MILITVWSIPFRMPPVTAEDKAAWPEIDRQYKALSSALLSRKRSPYSTISTRDMVWVESGARIKVDVLDKDYNDALKEVQSMDDFKVEIYSCKATNDKAQIITSTKMLAKTLDVASQKYKDMESVYNTIDTWVKRNGTWKLSETIIINRKIFMDGKDFWSEPLEDPPAEDNSKTGGEAK